MRLLSILTLLISTSTIQLFAQAPVNDECSGAITIPARADSLKIFSYTGNAGYATQSLPACPVSGNAAKDVWFKFTANGNGDKITLVPLSVSLNIAFEVLYGTCNNLNSVVCVNQGSGGVADSVILDYLGAGQTIYIRVFDYNGGNDPNAAFGIVVNKPGSLPACAGYTSPFNGDTISTSTNATLLWFSDVRAKSYDLYLWSGAVAPAAPIITMNGTNYFAVGLTPGTTYNWYVVPKNSIGSAASGCPSDPATFTTAPARPVNDDCEGAIAVVPSKTDGCGNDAPTIIADNHGATPSMPGCTGTAEDDIWFKFIATSARHTIKATTISQYSNPVVEVFSGNCGFLTSLGCFSNTAERYFTQEVVLSGLIPGNVYYFRVYGSSSNTARSEVHVCMGTLPTAPPNDECSGALSIPVKPGNDPSFSYFGNLGFATQSMPSCLDIRFAAKDVWFKFIATAAAHSIIVSPEHSTDDYAFQVFGGTCTNLAPLACVNTSSYGGLDTVVVNNLQPGQTYYMRVYDYHGAARPDQSFGIWIGDVNPVMQPGRGTGLQAVYYNNTILSGMPLLTRIDPTINFEFTYAHQPLSPAPGIVPEDQYSVRWTGKLMPLNSDYFNFTTASDDGIRLWINGVPLIDNWKTQGVTETQKGIYLVAGQAYDIVIEYFEGTGEAIAKLYWSRGNYSREIVPQSVLFPSDPALQPTLPCTVNTLPEYDARTYGNSARLQWRAVANADAYDVYLWGDAATPNLPTATVTDTSYLATGLIPNAYHVWYIVPRKANTAATGCYFTFSVFTSLPAPPAPTGSTGLKADYFNGINLSGTPLLSRIDTAINFELTYAHQPLTPAPGIVPEDLYSVRWAGKILPQYTEKYTFYTVADDGIRLWVNGSLLVDNWINQGATEKSGTIELIAGQKYDIVVEYFENTGEAVTKLLWSSANTPKQIIPKSQLFPELPAVTAGTGLQGDYFSGINLSGTPLLSRVDPTINFELTYAHQPLSPAPGIVTEDNYSVRWTGQVQAQYSETYTFYTVADDGIRLWVNGSLLVDNWINQGTTEKNGSISLLAGQKYDIVIEYYEHTGEAVTKLYWSGASTAKQIVPRSQLYPPANNNRKATNFTSVASSSTSPVLSAIPFISASIAPNPVKPGAAASLRIKSNKTATVSMQIIGSNGYIISTEKLTLAAGINTTAINTSLLAQGLYFISISGGNKPVNIKLLIE